MCVLEGPVDPTGYHPTHDQRLSDCSVFHIRLDRLQSSPTSRGRENSHSALGLVPFSREAVPYNATHAALIRGAKARGGDTEGAGEIGGVETQELVPVGQATGMLLGELARLDLDRLPIVLEPGQGSRHIVNLHHPLDPDAPGLGLAPARPADDLDYLPRRVAFD